MSRVVVAMQERRDRILEEASALLSRDGGDAFSLRKLAEAAGVTVPTLYNLIGNRDAILLELGSRMLERIERELDEIGDDEPLELAEAVVIHAIRMFADDEDLHRAAHVALDQLAHTYHEQRASHRERCVQLQLRAVRKAQQSGLLRGEIDARLLASQIYRGYGQAAREWTYGSIDLDQFRKRALLGVYLNFAADAEESLRPTLLARIAALSDTPLP